MFHKKDLNKSNLPYLKKSDKKVMEKPTNGRQERKPSAILILKIRKNVDMNNSRKDLINSAATLKIINQKLSFKNINKEDH